MPEKCAGCPRQAQCRKKACVAETRYVADAVVEITLIAHESLEIECPRSRARLRGSFPADVNAPMQYGDKLNALVVAFNTVGAVSTNRIHELFGNVFEIPLSTGTVLNMVSNCAANVKPVMEDVRDNIAVGPLAHFDETGSRVNKRLHWVHVASTDSETYLYLSEKRGISTAYRENPEPETIPGRKDRRKRGKVLALIDRLRKYKDAVCLFIKNFAVPFDNNQVERDLRMVKVKTKVSGCFRTEEGCQDFLNILAYTSTAKKQHVNPFYAILLAVKGQPCIAWT